MGNLAVYVINNCNKVMPPSRAIRYIIITLALIVVVTILAIGAYFLSQLYNCAWNWFGGIAGLIFAMVFGLIVLVKVPQKSQIAAIGVIGGMGADQLLNTLSDNSTSVTVISTLATTISKIVASVNTATSETGIPSPSRTPLSLGLWTFFIVLALIMLLGSLETQEDTSE